MAKPIYILIRSNESKKNKSLNQNANALKAGRMWEHVTWAYWWNIISLS